MPPMTPPTTAPFIPVVAVVSAAKVVEEESSIKLLDVVSVDVKLESIDDGVVGDVNIVFPSTVVVVEVLLTLIIVVAFVLVDVDVTVGRVGGNVGGNVMITGAVDEINCRLSTLHIF